MKAQELREKDIDALNAELTSLLSVQFKLRMQRASGHLGQPHQFKAVRRDIARIKMILNEKRVAVGVSGDLRHD